MVNKKTNVSFTGTAAQEQQLLKAIKDKGGAKNMIITVLQIAQDIYGYLPIEVQKIISEQMDVPLEEIYGIVTFYAQFTLNPLGQHKIMCCMGTACYVKGMGNILEKFTEKLGIKPGETTPDGKYSLEACRCIGACGLAPVLTVGEDVHAKLTVDDVDRIIGIY